jgi:hypothetical protein
VYVELLRLTIIRTDWNAPTTLQCREPTASTTYVTHPRLGSDACACAVDTGMRINIAGELDARPVGAWCDAMDANQRRIASRYYRSLVGDIVQHATRGPLYSGRSQWRYSNPHALRYSRFFVPLGSTIRQETRSIVRRIQSQVFGSDVVVDTTLRSKQMAKVHFLTRQQLYAMVSAATDMRRWSEQDTMWRASMSVAVGEVRYIKGKYYLMDLERAYPLRLKTDTIVRVTRIGTRQQYLLPSQGKDVRVDTVATAGGDDPGMWAWYTRKALRAALVAGELDDRSGLHPCPANYQFVVQEFGPDHLYRRPAKYRGGDFRPFEGEPHPSTGLYQLVVLERTFVCHIIHHGYQRSDTTPTCLRVMEVYIGRQTSASITTYEPMNGPPSFRLNYRTSERYHHQRTFRRDQLLFVRQLT